MIMERSNGRHIDTFTLINGPVHKNLKTKKINQRIIFFHDFSKSFLGNVVRKLHAKFYLSSSIGERQKLWGNYRLEEETKRHRKYVQTCSKGTI